MGASQFWERPQYRKVYHKGKPSRKMQKYLNSQWEISLYSQADVNAVLRIFLKGAGKVKEKKRQITARFCLENYPIMLRVGYNKKTATDFRL